MSPFAHLIHFGCEPYPPKRVSVLNIKLCEETRAGAREGRRASDKGLLGIGWSSMKFTKFLMNNAGPDLWKKKDDLFISKILLLPKQHDFESALTAISRAQSGATLRPSLP